MLIRLLEWQKGRGYRVASGVRGDYRVIKEAGVPVYTLRYFDAWLVGSAVLGDFSSYAKAEKAANDHNEALLREWLQPAATPPAILDHATTVLEWPGYIGTCEMPVMRAAQALARYVKETVVT